MRLTMSLSIVYFLCKQSVETCLLCLNNGYYSFWQGGGQGFLLLLTDTFELPVLDKGPAKTCQMINCSSIETLPSVAEKLFQGNDDNSLVFSDIIRLVERP
eukprot:gb/GEZN01034662.1/.p1 GENE.gb/GEZN01034662.1/~~gb/GEZN01034662.1/.p1  ORF type:complete len:101 (+),score=3.50 gb/GEZN01034662.1/:18-320(+)